MKSLPYRFSPFIGEIELDSVCFGKAVHSRMVFIFKFFLSIVQFRPSVLIGDLAMFMFSVSETHPQKCGQYHYELTENAKRRSFQLILLCFKANFGFFDLLAATSLYIDVINYPNSNSRQQKDLI